MDSTRSFLLLAAALATWPAFGNGINPPRPAELALVQARCVEDPENNPDAPSIYRAGVSGGKQADVIEFRASKAGIEQAPIANVKAVVIDDKSADGAGFVKGTVVLRNRLQPQKGTVKIRGRQPDHDHGLPRQRRAC